MSSELETRTYRVTRADLVAYANASGDQNPIHQDEQVARSVGLPGVIAHGMFTMALVGRAVESWAGPGPGRRARLQVHQAGRRARRRRRRRGRASPARWRDPADGLATIAMVVTCGDEKVLGAPKAVVRA